MIARAPALHGATQRFMLDTGVVISINRRHPDYVRRFLALAPGSCVMSALTWLELRAGALIKGGETERVVREFTAAVPVLPFDHAAAERGAEVRATLQRLGRRAGDFDEAIAGHAWQVGATLITTDSDLDPAIFRKHLSGISLVVWSEIEPEKPKKKSKNKWVAIRQIQPPPIPD